MQAKKILIYLTVAIAILLISILSIDINKYSFKVVEILKNQAQQQEIDLDIESPFLSFTKFSSPLVVVTIRQIFLKLKFEDVAILPNYKSLLYLKPYLTFSSNFYGGLLTGRIDKDKDITTSIKLKKSHLENHPIIRGLGLSGLASFFINFNQSKSNGKIEINLNNLNNPKEIKYNLQSFGIPMSIKIPTFKKSAIQAILEKAKNRINIQSLKIASSLFNLTTNGYMKISNDVKIEDLNLTFFVNLSNYGQKEFGAWLPIISQGSLNSSSSEFTISIHGNPLKPTVIFKAG